jgi:hypothetical protein
VSTPVKVSAFAAALAVVFAVAWAIGSAVGPLGDAPVPNPQPVPASTSGHEGHTGGTP